MYFFGSLLNLVADYSTSYKSSEKITVKPIKIENGILYQTNIMDFPGMEIFEVSNEYKISGNQMTLTQTIDDIVGKRIFERK